MEELKLILQTVETLGEVGLWALVIWSLKGLIIGVMVIFGTWLTLKTFKYLIDSMTLTGQIKSTLNAWGGEKYWWMTHGGELNTKGRNFVIKLIEDYFKKK